MYLNKKGSFIALLLFFSLTACKKEKTAVEYFDLKNYVIHCLYQETDGSSIRYKAQQQLLLSFANNRIEAIHVGESNSNNFPINVTRFNIYDKLYTTIDSLAVEIDTIINRTVIAGEKYGRTRPVYESNLIDIREKNWDLNNLKLKGKIELRNTNGALLQSPMSYIVFNNDASKINMQEIPPTGTIAFKNTVYFGANTNYYREANRGDASYQERLFLVFLKQKVILSGFYIDLITNNTFYYYGELSKL